MKTNKFKFCSVAEIPELMEEGIVYVAMHYSVAGMKCPCGCMEDVFLRIGGTQHPCWEISGNSISPSIQKNTGCKSHYTITNQVVVNNK